LKPERRILVLDGCRALAILSVMAFHYTVRWAPPLDPAGHLAAGAMFAGVWPLSFGWAGVEFFFVISGFVILMTLENTGSARAFLVRRFARIWPALIVATVITAAVVLAAGPADWRVNAYDLVDSIVLVGPNVVARVLHYQVKYVDGAYWSLWVEVRFYLLAVVVYYATRGWFLAFWLGLQAIAFAIWLLWPTEIADLLLFPNFLPYFTLGICIYKLYGGVERGLASAGAVIAASAILFNALSGNFDYGAQDVGLAGERLTFAGINLLILALFWLFLIDARIVSVLASRPAVRLGQASYSLYLLHQHLGVTIIRLGIGVGIPYLAMLPVTVALVIGLALLMFDFVETPAKRAIVAALGGSGAERIPRSGQGDR
jgi:peptidoglycan/LPS O-acetylase OafA/YrhL